MNISSLDHLVLTVANIEGTCTFYEDILGMHRVTLPTNRTSLTFGNQRINLHEHGHEFEPKAFKPTPGSGDLCFLTDTSAVDLVAHLQSHHIPIEHGPVERSVTAGTRLSVYFRDPDGNLIEVACPVP